MHKLKYISYQSARVYTVDILILEKDGDSDGDAAAAAIDTDAKDIINVFDGNKNDAVKSGGVL